MDTLFPQSLERLQANALAAEALLKSLGNAHRLMILCHLSQGERGVGELEAVLDLSQSALSQHLAKLRAQGLVSTRREGTAVYYAMKDAKALAVLETLYRLYCEPGA